MKEIICFLFCVVCTVLDYIKAMCNKVLSQNMADLGRKVKLCVEIIKKWNIRIFCLS
jgi:hypothetical protein